MADEIVASKQVEEFTAKINTIASGAASKIIESQDVAKRDILAAKSEALDSLSMVKGEIEKLKCKMADIASLTDRAHVVQGRLDAIEASLGGPERKSEEMAKLVGHVVRIKSSRTEMTAAGISSDGRIVCAWMTGYGEYHEATVPFFALEVAEREGSAK